MMKSSSGKLDEEPFVLVDKVRSALRLTAVDYFAQRDGLVIGMTLADARARVSNLRVRTADPDADARLLLKLAGMCEIFTPLVALDPPHGLLLDVTGCGHLFGGEAELCNRVCHHFLGIGIKLQTAIASTPEAAHVLARFSPGKIVSPSEEEQATRPLPVSALGFTSEITVALTRAGLKTLGDLADRPSTVLSARFGAELTTRLQRIMGREDIHITPLRAKPDCIVERRFAEPLIHSEGIVIALKELCWALNDLLEKRGLGGRAFEANFFRTDHTTRRLNIETAQATRNADSILRLFCLRMETLADPLDPGFGFDVIRISVLRSEALNETQQQLDGKEEQDSAIGRMIDRLVTRFGRNRVVRFVLRDTYDPVRMVAEIPVTRLVSSATLFSSEPNSPPARPLTLFQPPQPIETTAEVPDGPPIQFRWRRVLHQIARAEGPERIVSEWWTGEMSTSYRDYYRVEDTKGYRFWVFREVLYEGNERRSWFMHGKFA